MKGLCLYNTVPNVLKLHLPTLTFYDVMFAKRAQIDFSHQPGKLLLVFMYHGEQVAFEFDL